MQPVSSSTTIAAVLARCWQQKELDIPGSVDNSCDGVREDRRGLTAGYNCRAIACNGCASVARSVFVHMQFVHIALTQ
jgi:hypothetical protein